MKKIIHKILTVFLTSSVLISCGQDNTLEVPDYSGSSIMPKPPVLLMPSANYNKRPEKTVIDSVIIHHTAPFSNFSRVGYYFQMIDSRVSSHYILGKEGLIIESVPDPLRAWHGGPSSWKGKFNVNNYSIGIEVYNDGDGKDPFTNLQYISLARLVAWLIQTHNIPLSRVIGHRDIAFPMGRKVDPANNFDWKIFKSLIRHELGKKDPFWNRGDLPQENNTSANDIKELLKSPSHKERVSAVDNLLTVDYRSISTYVDKAFQSEKDPDVLARFFHLFSVYNQKQYQEKAWEYLKNYHQYPGKIIIPVMSYLNVTDKDKLRSYLPEFLKYSDLTPGVKGEVVRILGYFPDMIPDLINYSKNNPQREVWSALSESLSREGKTEYNSELLKLISSAYPAHIRSITAENLRNTYNPEVEKSFIKIIKDGDYNQEILSSIATTMLRKNSHEGMKLLTNDNIFPDLDNREKIALINTIGISKRTDLENWLVKQLSETTDIQLKASIYLALGRLKTPSALNIILKNTDSRPELSLTQLRAIGYTELPETIPWLLKVLSVENTPIITSVKGNICGKPFSRTRIRVAKNHESP